VSEANDQQVSEPNASTSADTPAQPQAWTPLTAGPPKLVSLASTLAAALILAIAIAVTVLSYSSWGVGGADEAEASQPDTPATEPESPAERAPTTPNPAG
jgi:hypothetical protein